MILLFFSICLVGGYFSYAIFTVQEEKTKAISIITGTLNPTITSTDGAFANNQIVVSASTTKEIDIKLTNNNNRDAKFNLYYMDSLPSGLSVGYVESTKDIPPDTNGIVLGQGKSEEYTLKIVNNSSSSFTLRIGSDGGLSNQPLSFPTNGHIFELLDDSTGVETLLAKVNDASITNYEVGDMSEMYTFTHEAGEQQASWTSEELTDYRYIGDAPKNYLWFNDEIWRIIGIFTVEDAAGRKERRMKIMRNEFLTPYLVFDSTTLESEYGKNRWSDSQLQELLNPGYESQTGGSLYWNQQKGTCYGSTEYRNSKANQTTTCDFTTIGLNDIAKNQIATVKWYTGGKSTSMNSASGIYYQERGINVYNQYTNYPRETSWLGKIGLIYLSDYGYTYANHFLSKCFDDPTNCLITDQENKSWMYSQTTIQWSLFVDALSPERVYFPLEKYFVYDWNANRAHGVRPVVYLNSGIQIISGDGTSTNPYAIQ